MAYGHNLIALGLYTEPHGADEIPTTVAEIRLKCPYACYLNNESRN